MLEIIKKINERIEDAEVTKKNKQFTLNQSCRHTCKCTRMRMYVRVHMRKITRTPRNDGKKK